MAWVVGNWINLRSTEQSGRTRVEEKKRGHCCRGHPRGGMASMRLFRQGHPAFLLSPPIAMAAAIRKQPFVKFERTIACAGRRDLAAAVRATSQPRKRLTTTTES
ncbi:hypothetical protein MRX96_036148 [Rhipicephalus microplus]